MKHNLNIIILNFNFVCGIRGFRSSPKVHAISKFNRCLFHKYCLYVHSVCMCQYKTCLHFCGAHVLKIAIEYV